MDWQTLLCKQRPRPSTNPGDHRVEFERDFDRTVFSTPVKRLQDKAQVFPLEPHDAIRTRLTHSLEVSSVARGLAEAIGRWLIKEAVLDSEAARSFEAIAATCGLIHDLGNPPFGHSGEDSIRYWFKNRFGEERLREAFDHEQHVQDFLQFEGNAQTLRLLTKLQILADFHGLNLTYGTLSAMCKYTAPSHEAGKDDDHARSKAGYFASENSIVSDIRTKTGTGPSRNPITFVAEAADDIVYSVADIEDAVKKGILGWIDVLDYIDHGSSHEMVKQALKGKDRILGHGTGHPDDVHASAFRTSVIGIAVAAVIEEFKKRYNSIMCGEYKGELVMACSAAPLVKRLKDLGRDRVYCTSSNLKLEVMGRRVICDLMDIFWEGAEKLPIDDSPKPNTFPGKIGALLSANYRKVFCHSVRQMRELPEQYHRLQLVTDYICGMTDSFAKRLHSELMNG